LRVNCFALRKITSFATRMAHRPGQTSEEEPQDATPITQAVLTQQLAALTQSFAKSLGAIDENFKAQQRVTESQNHALAEQQRTSSSLQRSLQEMTQKADRGYRELLEAMTQIASRQSSATSSASASSTSAGASTSTSDASRIAAEQRDVHAVQGADPSPQPTRWLPRHEYPDGMFPRTEKDPNLPQYDGNTDIREHFSLLEDIFLAKNVSETGKLNYTVLTFRGQVRAFVKEKKPTSYDELKAILLKRYQLPNEEYHLTCKLRSLHQNGENVDTYVKDFKYLLSRLPNISENDKFVTFFNGLQPAVMQEVLRLKVTDYETAEQTAIDYYACRKISKLQVSFQSGLTKEVGRMYQRHHLPDRHGKQRRPSPKGAQRDRSPRGSSSSRSSTPPQLREVRSFQGHQ